MTLGWLVMLVGIGGVLAARFGGVEARTLRLLQRLPRTSIRDAPDGGRIRLVGRVRLAEHPLRAPLSGRPCAGWVVRVDERVASGWSPVLMSQRVRSFFVEDGTGRALVRTERLRLAKVKDLELRAGRFHAAAPELERWLGDRGVDRFGFTGLVRTLRCREGILTDGAAVAVSGRGRWEPDPEPSSTGEHGSIYRVVSMRLTMGAGAREAVLASDLPEALGAGELQAAGEARTGQRLR